MSANRNLRSRSEQKPSPSPLSKTLNKTMDDSSKIWSKMDEHLQKQSEVIISLLSNRMAEMETRISQQIESQIAEIKNDISDINKRVTQIEVSQTNLIAENELLKTEMFHLKSTISDVKAELSQSTSNCKTEMNEFEVEINWLKTTLETHENRLIACDAIINGIPFSPNENLKTIFHKLCLSLEIQPPTANKIFRTRPTKDTRDSAIILKFGSPYDKNTLLRSIAVFRKQNGRQICLREVGMDSEKPIFIRECLTRKNHYLLQAALKLKKHKQLSSVFTARGLVYVKRKQKYEAVHIDNNDDLSRVAMTTDQPHQH